MDRQDHSNLKVMGENEREKIHIQAKHFIKNAYTGRRWQKNMIYQVNCKKIAQKWQKLPSSPPPPPPPHTLF